MQPAVPSQIQLPFQCEAICNRHHYDSLTAHLPRPVSTVLRLDVREELVNIHLERFGGKHPLVVDS